MSTLTMVEAKKEATPAMASLSSVTPQRHFELRRQVNQAADGGAFDRTSAEPGFGHDYGRIPVQAPSVAIGDGATRRAAQSCPLVAGPRACPFGGACHTCPTQVQAKLAIGRSDHAYEQEADKAVERVMRMPPDQTLQRRCASCDENDGDILRAKGLPQQAPVPTPDSAVPPIVHEVLRSPGQPLDPATRAFMEARFGRDLSHVCVHTDARAAESAQAVESLAYTVGSDLVFGSGRYAPQTVEGLHLLAHELAHVLQRAGGGAQPFTLRRTSHGLSTLTNCHNWTIPLPPWIAGTIAHGQVSATLKILPHLIPRATKLLKGVPTPPTLTPPGFADLWVRGADALFILLLILVVLAIIALVIIAILCAAGIPVTFGASSLCTAAAGGLAVAGVGAAAALLLMIGLPTSGLSGATASLLWSVNPAATETEPESGPDYERNAGYMAGITTPSSATASGAVAGYNPGDEFLKALSPLVDRLSNPMALARSVTSHVSSLPRDAVAKLNTAVAALENMGDAVTSSFVRRTIQSSGLDQPGALAEAETGSLEEALAQLETGAEGGETATAEPTASSVEEQVNV